MRILCLLICLVTMGCGACDDYYVDIDAIGGACDDAGPGSIDEPWQTLGRIMADQEPRPGPGDTVWIRGGVYDHSLILTRGGEEGLPLTVSAYQDETPVIDGGGTLPRGVVFSDGGSADHIVLDGLTVRNLADGGVGIMISGRTDVTIQNADVSGARMGVWPGACSNVQIRDSEIHHNSNGNIYLDSRNVDIVIADCHIHHTEKAHNISVYAPGNAVRTSGLPVGLDINDGVATFGIEGVDLSKVRRGTLTGQDAEGSVPCPAVVLLFPDENPIPNGLPLPGGSIRLPDGRDWYAMRAVPEWDGKPYSQDGTLGQFYIGDADPNTILQAKHIFVTYLFPDDVANRDIQILRNEIHHAYTQGIWVQRAEGVLIEGNTTHHNGASGIQIESLSRRIWIEDNTSYANGLHHNHETGMWIDETIDAVVQGNTCYENQKAMGITQCEWVIARRNFLYNNRAQHCGGDPAGCRRNAGAFWFNGGRHNNLGAPPGAQNNALVHNTMWGNGTQESVWGGIQHGINGYPRVGSNAIINNLVQNCLGAAPIFISALPGALDGNLYAAAGPFTAFIAGKGGGARHALADVGGLAAYREATGLDAASRIVEVEFADPDAGDFTLSPDSPAIDAGRALANTTAAGSGRDIPVDRPSCFTAGLRDRNDNVIKQGDVIRVAGATARIVAIDREQFVLTVDADLTWDEGDDVNYPYEGAAPTSARDFIGGGHSWIRSR